MISPVMGLHHQALTGVGCREHTVCFYDVERKRLFTKHMLSRTQGHLTVMSMLGHRQSNVHGVDLRVGAEFGIRAVGVGDRQLSRHLFSARRVTGGEPMHHHRHPSIERTAQRLWYYPGCAEHPEPQARPWRVESRNDLVLRGAASDHRLTLPGNIVQAM